MIAVQESLRIRLGRFLREQGYLLANQIGYRDNELTDDTLDPEFLGVLMLNQEPRKSLRDMIVTCAQRAEFLGVFDLTDESMLKFKFRGRVNTDLARALADDVAKALGVKVKCILASEDRDWEYQSLD